VPQETGFLDRVFSAMGSEIAVPVFGPIVLITAIVLVIVAIMGWRRPISVTSTLGLGRRRIALGYLGSLVACIPVAIWMAKDDARFQIANHYISVADAVRYQPGWSLEFYFMTTPITIVLITVVGLPILTLLRKIRLASVVGALGAGILVAALLSYWADEAPAENITMFLTIIAGFVLAARLPWIKSPKLPAKKALGEPHNADEA
jgi:hypothetical protein